MQNNIDKRREKKREREREREGEGEGKRIRGAHYIKYLDLLPPTLAIRSSKRSSDFRGIRRRSLNVDAQLDRRQI